MTASDISGAVEPACPRPVPVPDQAGGGPSSPPPADIIGSVRRTAERRRMLLLDAGYVARRLEYLIDAEDVGAAQNVARMRIAARDLLGLLAELEDMS